MLDPFESSDPFDVFDPFESFEPLQTYEPLYEPYRYTRYRHHVRRSRRRTVRTTVRRMDRELGKLVSANYVSFLDRSWWTSRTLSPMKSWWKLPIKTSLFTVFLKNNCASCSLIVNICLKQPNMMSAKIQMAVFRGSKLSSNSPNPINSRKFLSDTFCWFLRFRRRITIPPGVKQESITSTMSPEGLLTIMAPKTTSEGTLWVLQLEPSIHHQLKEIRWQ